MIEKQSRGEFSRRGGKGLVRHYPYFEVPQTEKIKICGFLTKAATPLI
jgi:hypothetical protein